MAIGYRAHRATRVAGIATALFWGLSANNIAAHAADLGGNCCADLEERVAELEATTARKGNRKVSLTIAGYVAQEITYWDDGVESNVYIHGLGPTQTSNIRFLGKAQIAPGWTAGYLIRIQDLTQNAFAVMNQDNASNSSGLNTQMAFWFIESKEYGKVAVGRNAQAAKSVAMFTDQSGTQLGDNYTFFAGFPAFALRTNAGTGLTWGQMGYCYSQGAPVGGDCNGIVSNGVRYDSPAMAGFSMSASWAEDDFWEVAGRYAGEVGGFKLAFGIGYSSNSDESLKLGSAITYAASQGKESKFLQAGGYIQHMATGLFVHGAYGQEKNDGLVGVAVGTHEAPDSEHYYVKAGIRQKWVPLGATVIYGDYAVYLDQLGPAALDAGATSSTFERYGAGIAQEIDSAAMTVYLKYQQYTGEMSGASLGGTPITSIDDITLVSAGAWINF